MRDLAIVVFIFGMVPIMIKRPWIGLMMWVWISVMTPHAFGWGLASELRVAVVAGAATLIGLIVTKDRVKLPINSTTVLLMLLPIWMSVTLIFAFNFDEAVDRWEQVLKIFLFILISAAVLHTRKHVDVLIWVLVFSVGFFGVKGGIFTIATGGAYRVWGPPGTSFISDNNSISVALVMVIPLMYYLALHATRRVVKYALYGAMGLSAIAVLGSHSRGAFLAIIIMSTLMAFKSRRKVMMGAILVALLPIAILAMPEQWKDRMRTVETYEEDSSAMGRINAWHTAFNIANHRPLVGGGFELYTPEVFAKYAPVPEDVHAAHSIYFQMLGEHGYVGLLLFLALGINGWIVARRIVQYTSRKPEFAWASDVARAIQVSLAGFAVGGGFVNIAYWELQYYELVMLMVVWNVVRNPVPETTGASARAPVGRSPPLRA